MHHRHVPSLPVKSSSNAGAGSSRKTEQVKWILLFALTAEVFTSCFVPEWKHPVYNVNYSATVLNLFGGFLEGVLVEYTIWQMDDSKICLASCFRTGFLGVLTSYSFMVEHAANLSRVVPWFPLFYIAFSLIGACAACTAGKIFCRIFIMGKRQRLNVRNSGMLRSDHRRKLASKKSDLQNFSSSFNNNDTGSRSFFFLQATLIAFIVFMCIVATVGPAGLVRDPNDPKRFVAKYKVNDGIELLCGMLMSGAAIFISRAVGTGSYHASVDWGTWRCNVLSCILATLAYGTRVLVPSADENLIVAKFVMSFCGSLSCFSATIAHTMTARINVSTAFFNLGLNAVTALVFLLVFV